MSIEILLEYQCCCFAVDALATRSREHCRGISLIDQRCRHAKTTMKLIGKTPAANAHFMLGAIRMQGQANNDGGRLPLGDEFTDGDEFCVIGRGIDQCQRLGLPEQHVADSDADTSQTKIESHHRAHAREAHASRTPATSRMPGFSGQHTGIDAEKAHGSVKSHIDGCVENNGRIGAHC